VNCVKIKKQPFKIARFLKINFSFIKDVIIEGLLLHLKLSLRKTIKNAVVQCLDYQIPVIQLKETRQMCKLGAVHYGAVWLCF